jgi:CIC family chloride channel protein
MTATSPAPAFSKIRSWLDELRQSENQLVLVLSLVVGILVGLVTVGFILVTGRLAAHMYPAGGSGWRRILVPTLGALSTGFLLAKYFPFARGSGIPQAKFALVVNDGLITFRTIVGKLLCCSTSLASGLALGREGPSVQIGAGVASVIGRNAGLKVEQVKALIPVGCSAALAAAFNTPIAAVMFTLEEIMGDLHATVLGTAVLSSAAAWMVLHYFLGDDPLFHVPAYRLVHPEELGIYAVLGVVGGLASVVFVKLLLGMRARFMRLPKSTVWIQPVVGGLTVGLLGYFYPDVMGVGYDYIDRVLNGDAVLKMVVLLGLLKIVATATCYASGNAGGIFGPSLFIGAMMGAATGGIAHKLFPGITAGPGAYALVGMGTAFAGIIRTPFTSVIMIFELTRDYTIIVPLMISNTIAYFISQKFQPVTIYDALAQQDGVHLPSAHAHGPTGPGNATLVMRAAPLVLSAQTTVQAALQQAQDSSLDAWPVAAPSGLAGMVRRTDLANAIAREAGATTLETLLNDLPSRNSASPEFIHIHPDHSLHLVLERMGSGGCSVLPVVSRASVRQLMGIVVLDDVLKAYGVVGHSPAAPATGD